MRLGGQTLEAIVKLARARLVFVLACVLVIVTHVSGLTQTLDGRLAAHRASIVTREPTGSLVVVEIDSASVRAARTWPWPRERFAIAIRNLRTAGATLVAFDVDFSARSSRESDAALAAAIDAAPGEIVLPTFVQPNDPLENAPLEMLSRNATVASVNIPIESDGRVRRYYRGYQHGEHYHASMASVLASAPYGQTAPFTIDYGIRSDRISRIGFHDVYRGTFDPALVRGKIILIGATALELGDEFATPNRTIMPGVLVHALAYESVVQGRALLNLSGGVVLFLALSALVVLWPKPGSLNLSRMFVRNAAVLSASLVGPIVLQIFAPVSASLGLVLFAQTLCIAVSLRQELQQRARDLLRQREEHLSYVALHDPETNLPNRRAMLEDLARRCASRDGVVVAIAIGIERFPLLRGAVGYGNANRLVCGLAERIAACSGESDVYHISTSILGLVMTAPCEEQAQRLCAGALNALDTSVALDGQNVELVIRAGAAIASADVASGEALLEHATLALDQARLRKVRYLRYDAAEVVDPLRQLAMISEIGAGLERGEFTLLYQPKSSAAGGEIVGAEALMRWRHPVHGAIAPDEFISAAEKTGAIDVLTRWAVRRAIADQMEMRKRGVELSVAVNVSGRCLSDIGFCNFVIAKARKSDARLCLEITETAIIGDPQAAMSSIAAFRRAGIRIAIDDYGSGLSSLAYLKQIAADELKLDKSLLRELRTQARDRLIVKSTIDLAHGLGMSVVAEGVEDETAFALLTAMGCDLIQGFYISSAVTAQRLVEMCQPNATLKAAAG